MAGGYDYKGYEYEPGGVRAGIIQRSLLQPAEKGDFFGAVCGPAADVEGDDELAPPEDSPEFADRVLC